mgnify:FL=1|jgi:hypothetical protein|tara:strand:+ start:1139 stop:1753 length:615 start_codon:yes stop_codon:yes gene_type:complete
MATKISELTATTTVTGDDLLLVVDNPANTSSIESKKVTVNNFFGSLGTSVSNGVSASIAGNTLTISLEAPSVKTYKVENERITTQSNAAPYANTIATSSTDANVTANGHTLNLSVGGSLLANVALNGNGEPIISLSTNEAKLQNPAFNTVRVLKLNYTTQATPSNSSYVNSTFAYVQGDSWYDSNNVYIAVSNTEIKKVALSAI